MCLNNLLKIALSMGTSDKNACEIDKSGEKSTDGVNVAVD